jgi:DNA-binding response OmpR family regulator
MIKATPLQPAIAAGDGPTVLVIDDDVIVRQTLEILLEEHGFGVVTAVDGEDGQRKFHALAPDIVITDIIMPNKEGIELILELRRECPDARIIAISGGGRIGNSDFVTIATRLGADAGLQKPFDPEQLFGTIRSVLARPARAPRQAA